MRKLFIVRHGSHTDGKLNQEGYDQMLSLGGKIRAVMDGGTVRVLSSTAPRAVTSANILAVRFGVKVLRRRILWWDEDHREDLVQALQLVRQAAGADHVVVVTHLDYVEHLPSFFASKEWSDESIHSFRVATGEAVVLDCERRVAEPLRP